MAANMYRVGGMYTNVDLSSHTNPVAFRIPTAVVPCRSGSFFDLTLSCDFAAIGEPR